MVISVDKNYRKENLDKFNIQIEYSLRLLFLRNFGSVLPIIILAFILSFTVPFVPHPTYGLGGKAPATFSDYTNKVFQIDYYFFLIMLAIIILNSFYEYLRAHFYNRAGYKKIGNFKVTKILNLGYLKIVHLNYGRKLKIKNADRYFDEFIVGQIVEIQRTASNKLLSYKVLT